MEDHEIVSLSAYEPRDCCFGVVTGRCRNGIFVELDSGEAAFSYTCANLYPGAEVYCSVKRPARDDLRMLVTVDSVIRYAS